MNRAQSQNQEVEVGYVSGSNLVDPFDLHRMLKNKSMEIAGSQLTTPVTKSPIDTSWLVSCSKAYNISPNIEDYVLVPVVIFPADVPNRNNVGFTRQDLAAWSVEYGCTYSRTWRGKPTFYEHDHDEPLKANGVILDTQLVKDRAGFWKLLLFKAFDRTKSVDLVDRILRQDIGTYSMGAYITGGYECSICRRKLGTCRHLDKKGQEMRLLDVNGRKQVGFRIGRLPVGFESSVVETPAWSLAASDVVITR